MTESDAVAMDLFERHRPLARSIARMAARLSHARLDPDEVENVALLALWAAIPRYRSDKGAFGPFAAKIMRWRISDYVRNAGPVKRGAYRAGMAPPVSLPVSLTDGHESPVAAIERADEVRQALSLLSERDARVIRLIYLDGLTQAETAGRVGLSESRVCQIVTAALAHMRRQLLPKVA